MFFRDQIYILCIYKDPDPNIWNESPAHRKSALLSILHMYQTYKGIKIMFLIIPQWRQDKTYLSLN